MKSISSSSNSNMATNLSKQLVPLNDPALTCCCFSSPSSLASTSCEPETIYDRICAMRHQEATHYRIDDYFARSAPPTSKNGILSSIKNSGGFFRRGQESKESQRQTTDANCRDKMARWCYQVVDYCNLHRETVEVALSILDRFLCLANAQGNREQDPHPVALDCLEDRKTFQLAAMTCLYTAIKMFEVEVMDPSIVASLSRGMCEENEVIAMESTILEALDWRINGPTSHAAVDHLVQLLDASSNGVQQQRVKRVIIERARHYVQLAIIEYELMTVRPTLVAYAAIINALENISVYDLTSEDRMAFVSDMTLAVLHPTQDDVVSSRTREARSRRVDPALAE